MAFNPKAKAAEPDHSGPAPLQLGAIQLLPQSIGGEAQLADGGGVIGEPAVYPNRVEELKSELKDAQAFWKNDLVSPQIVDWPVQLYTYDGVPFIAQADCLYRRDRPIYVFPYFWTLSPANRIDTIRHEFGHCLQMPHNTDEPNSIMFPFLNVLVENHRVITDTDRTVYRAIWHLWQPATVIHLASPLVADSVIDVFSGN